MGNHCYAGGINAGLRKVLEAAESLCKMRFSVNIAAIAEQSLKSIASVEMVNALNGDTKNGKNITIEED